MKTLGSMFAGVLLAVFLIILILLITISRTEAQDNVETDGVYSLVPNPVLSLMDQYDPDEFDCQVLECEIVETTPLSGMDATVKTIQLESVIHPNQPGEKLVVWYVEIDYEEEGIQSLFPRYLHFSWNGQKEETWKEGNEEYKLHTIWKDQYVMNFATDISAAHIIDQSETDVAKYHKEPDGSWRLISYIDGGGSHLLPEVTFVEGAMDAAILSVDLGQEVPVVEVFNKEYLDNQLIVLVDKVWESATNPLAYVGTWELRLARDYESVQWEGTKTPQHLVLDGVIDVWPETAFVYDSNGAIVEEIYLSIFAPMSLDA